MKAQLFSRQQGDLITCKVFSFPDMKHLCTHRLGDTAVSGKPEPQKLFSNCPKKEQDGERSDSGSGTKLTFQDPPNSREASSISLHEYRLKLNMKQHKRKQPCKLMSSFNALICTYFTCDTKCSPYWGMGIPSQKSCFASGANSC